MKYNTGFPVLWITKLVFQYSWTLNKQYWKTGIADTQYSTMQILDFQYCEFTILFFKYCWINIRQFRYWNNSIMFIQRSCPLRVELSTDRIVHGRVVRSPEYYIRFGVFELVRTYDGRPAENVETAVFAKEEAVGTSCKYMSFSWDAIFIAWSRWHWTGTIFVKIRGASSYMCGISAFFSI